MTQVELTKVAEKIALAFSKTNILASGARKLRSKMNFPGKFTSALKGSSKVTMKRRGVKTTTTTRDALAGKLKGLRKVDEPLARKKIKSLRSGLKADRPSQLNAAASIRSAVKGTATSIGAAAGGAGYLAGSQVGRKKGFKKGVNAVNNPLETYGRPDGMGND